MHGPMGRSRTFCEVTATAVHRAVDSEVSEYRGEGRAEDTGGEAPGVGSMSEITLKSLYVDDLQRFKLPRQGISISLVRSKLKEKHREDLPTDFVRPLPLLSPPPSPHPARHSLRPQSKRTRLTSCVRR